jgi:hypothetical protein
MTLTYWTEKGAERSEELRHERPRKWSACIVSNSWMREPMIHREDIYAQQNGATFCGRTMPGAPVLPYEHAIKIGRRCKQCFSKGRA